MPKITVAGGASNADAPPAPVALATPADRLRAAGKLGPYTDAEQAATSEEAGEQPSPGSSSSTSSRKPQTPSEPNSTTRRKPARETASRSPKGRTGASSARSGAIIPGPETDVSDGD